jgi:hypothetical protein
MILDKTRNLAGVLMACYMNTKKVRDQITYKKFYGDKESYWLSSALTSTPYHFVPGYSGGIGRITNPFGNVNIEEICTLQILHVLESTGEPLWFNNAIIESKAANDAQYIVAEGWVGHNGRWHPGGTRFRNEFCVNMPVSGRDRLVGFPKRVTRIEGILKARIETIVQEVSKYDALMRKEGLVTIR